MEGWRRQSGDRVYSEVNADNPMSKGVLKSVASLPARCLKRISVIDHVTASLIWDDLFSLIKMRTLPADLRAKLWASDIGFNLGAQLCRCTFLSLGAAIFSLDLLVLT